MCNSAISALANRVNGNLLSTRLCLLTHSLPNQTLQTTVSKTLSFGVLKPYNVTGWSNTMAQSYKALKENFVSNLSGGTIIEVYYVTAVAPVSIILTMLLQYTDSSHSSLLTSCGPRFNLVRNFSSTTA